MKQRDQDNFEALFGQFMPPAEAEAKAEEIRAADAMLRAHPAPKPRPEIIVGVKLRIADKLAGQHRHSHPFVRFVGAAAAVLVVAFIGLSGHFRPSRPEVTHAALIPTAIWESDDLATDDLDIAYFTAEIRQIETQMYALEAGEGDAAGVATLSEVEMELMRINTEFWKE
jgi:hypothetical protein